MQYSIQSLFWVLTAVTILFTLIPLVRKDHWTFRIFEFPRFQKWIINLAILLSYIFVSGFSTTTDWVLITLLLLNLGYLTYQIYPYLSIAPKQIQSALAHQDPDIKILVANVFQDNKKYNKLIDLVNENDADIVLLVETNLWWKEKCLEGFGKQYEYQIFEERENTYGMLLFSKFELSNSKVRHLIKESIPSIATDITLKNKKKIKLFALHPEPPVPTENPYSTDRDAELLIIAKEVEHDKNPLIVAGDLNDVAWSYSSTLFQKVSGLLDPRRGRGFFSSFHAKYPIFRWPLDHIFCSGHFRVHEMKRLRNIGSDHFPILISLHLAPTEDDSKKLVADEEDKKLAEEKIREA